MFYDPGAMSSPIDMFSPADGLAYLDTATYGLAPLPTIAAMTASMEAWQRGTARWIEDFDMAAERARSSFATLIGVPTSDVALIPAASVGVGTVAASLTDSDRVLVPDDEFTSLLFPLLVAEERGTVVSRASFDTLLDRIEPGTTLVAFSLVQMQTGGVASLEAIIDRAREVGARVLVDATHGLPFVGMGGVLHRVDYVVCAAYKHLLCPRGVAFLVVRREHHDELVTWNANWRATDGRYDRFFGGALTHASDASRFDVSAAWLPATGAATSLELLCEWSAAGELDRANQMARRIADGLGVEWGGASIVCVPIADLDAALAALDAGRIKAAVRGDSVRLSTHVYTTDSDLDRVVDVLGPFATAP